MSGGAAASPAPRRVDPFLSAAAEGWLPISRIGIEDLRPDFRNFRDKTASAVPVSTLFEDVYHTVVVDPATSNTVARCGISDWLAWNASSS